MALEHLTTWTRHQPWAIEQTQAAEILTLLSDPLAAVSADALARRLHPSREQALRERKGSVAVIPLHGVMAQRRLFGGTSTEAVGRAIDTAVADTSVKAIVLHIDSPGGAVTGTRELAAKVLAAREVMPIIAQADSMAASGAYWVASQATEIVATLGGAVGSIGVFALHEDLSALLERSGISPTIISAGKYKTEGHPFGPLGDEARAHFQSVVDEAYADFVAAVAGGRGVAPEVVEATYGQGRMLQAQKALAAGMVDRIATFEETLARFAPKPTFQRRARAAQALARTA